jgi:hypothetical protein
MSLIKLFSYFTFNKYVVKAYQDSDGNVYNKIDDFLIAEYLIIKDKYKYASDRGRRKLIRKNKKVIIETEKILRKASPSFVSYFK